MLESLETNGEVGACVVGGLGRHGPPPGAGRESSGEARQEGKIEERKAAVLSVPGTAWTGGSAGTTGRLLMDSVGVVALGCSTLAVLKGRAACSQGQSKGGEDSKSPLQR